MSKLNNNQINEYLDKLLNFAEGLPMREVAKNYIKAKVLIDFLDTWQFDDEANGFSIDDYLSDPKNTNYIDVKTTYGICNTSQINRYINNFISALKKSRIKALNKHLKELDQLHPALKAARLSKSLAAISRTELFAKYGFEKVKDPEWNAQLKEILGHEISFSKDQAEILTKAPTPTQQQIDNSDDILIVEELENRIAIEAVEYRRKCDDLWEQYKFDPSYFDTFISVTLINEFIKSLYDRIRPLNNQEINRYLSLSLQQFKTHTPAKRHKAFLLNYFHTYWFPNAMEYKNEEYMDKYATHVWKHYANHFSLFKEATEKIYDEFRAGLIGTPQSPIIHQTLKSKISNNSLQSFTYNNFIVGQTNLTDLMNSLKRNNFIAEDTSLKHFRKAFSGRDINKKILWTGSISALSYFIKQLHNVSGKIKNTKQKQWDITIKCFQMSDGSTLDKTKLRTQKAPSNSDVIEKTIRLL